MRTFWLIGMMMMMLLLSCQIQVAERQVIQKEAPVTPSPTPPITTPTQPIEGRESQPLPPSQSIETEAFLDSSFLLQIGQVARITSEALAIKFIQVKEDSRCPVGVSCVWAGRVTVEVKVVKSGKDLGSFDLSTTERKGQYVDNYLISMGKVSPSPSGQLKPEEYTVAFTVYKFVRKTT